MAEKKFEDYKAGEFIAVEGTGLAPTFNAVVLAPAANGWMRVDCSPVAGQCWFDGKGELVPCKRPKLDPTTHVQVMEQHPQSGIIPAWEDVPAPSSTQPVSPSMAPSTGSSS